MQNVFVWTVGDVFGLAIVALVVVAFGIGWCSDYIKRKLIKQALPKQREGK